MIELVKFNGYVGYGSYLSFDIKGGDSCLSTTDKVWVSEDECEIALSAEVEALNVFLDNFTEGSKAKVKCILSEFNFEL